MLIVTHARTLDACQRSSSSHADPLRLFGRTQASGRVEPFGVVIGGSSRLTQAAVASNGRWVAYNTAKTSDGTVYVHPLPATGATASPS